MSMQTCTVSTCPTCGQDLPADRVPAREAAALLRVSRTRVYQLLEEGKLERHPQGGVTRTSVEARKEQTT